MQITTLTGEQPAAFVKAVQPVYDYYIAKGMFTKEMLDKMREAASR